MRSSILPRRRQIARICDTCRQQQQRSLSTSFSPPVSTRAASASAARISPSSQDKRHTLTPRRHVSQSTSARSAESPQPSSTEAESATAAAPAPAQPPQTHYDFFPLTLPAGPPPAGAFAIDVRALRREFLALQSKAHPDLHPAHDKTRAEALSSRINEAYRTLASPLLRAQYLLAQRGRDVAADETAQVADPELLMEVLEAREEIEEAAEEAELEALRRRNEDREDESARVLAQAFADGDMDLAASEAVRLRYWVNIRESLQNWEKGKPIVLEH